MFWRVALLFVRSNGCCQHRPADVPTDGHGEGPVPVIINTELEFAAKVSYLLFVVGCTVVTVKRF